MSYKEYKNLDLTSLSTEIIEYWKQNKIFERSISEREGRHVFTFYEGPPSVNGKPGIHHVLSRTVKDIFCRYKTLQGYQVKRKSGWDTHGLPVELQVEKRLGLRKEDIGEKISIADYNAECKKDVLKFKEEWEDLTERIGFWLDFDDVYITYDKKYIESLWHLLKKLFDKNLLYKDYTIQPYSPAAGTALSSHELNQPGCYKPLKDVSMVAQFKISGKENEYLLAWTTTPWTLPSNTGLAVGPNINYLKVQTFNPYTGKPIIIYLAEDTFSNYFNEDNKDLDFNAYQEGQKDIPYKILATVKGKEMKGWKYEQLMPYVQPNEGNPFRVVTADFVTTEEGTGIVHMAPTFGDDDYKTGKKENIPPLLVQDPEFPDKQMPLVNKKGQFVNEVTDFAGRYVKNYEENPDDYQDVNVDIAVKLKKENKAFKIEKYVHNYPHCWRTDRPVIYYPIESWFIKTTAVKEKLINYNKKINWKPKSTGEGRFGNWLENMVDWNLSRSRFWGTPLPIWETETSDERKCIGSYEELKREIQQAVEAGIQQEALPDDFDPHRPFVDDITLISSKGEPMKRVEAVIDVWFDSGAMPYAQWHYPFENQKQFEKNFPADFIAEGVDQTRGWFYTLHAIATMLFDSVAYKNVIATGLVLDKNGNKMSKRLGNTVDPFETLDKYGADATRWYMLHNAQLWDNLKFDLEGIDDIRKKFLGTLYNVYSFFALYANIDSFKYDQEDIPIKNRPEIDRWIISLLNTLALDVEELMDDYEPTKAVRKIQDFVVDHLSNWYVRLCRRRFWKSEDSTDKLAAYQTLYQCLQVVAQLISPFAPFFADRLFIDLNSVTGKIAADSVHLSDFPKGSIKFIDKDLVERMEVAQVITSLTLALRKKAKIKVRQPLSKIMIPVLDKKFQSHLEKVRDLIRSEVNVKEIEYISDTSDVLVKKIKPDFKLLGPKFGKYIKGIQQYMEKMNQKEINDFEKSGSLNIKINDETIFIHISEVEILSEDIPGWLVNSAGKYTVALDITITDDLKYEGIAREVINRIQNLRKSNDYEVTDRINIFIEKQPILGEALVQFKNYICEETLSDSLSIEDNMIDQGLEEIQIDGINTKIDIKKA